MITFFILGGAALLLLIKPSLFKVDRDEGLLDLGFMQPGEPKRHSVLGGAGASTGTLHDTSHQTTLQDLSVDELRDKVRVDEQQGESDADVKPLILHKLGYSSEEMKFMGEEETDHLAKTGISKSDAQDLNLVPMCWDRVGYCNNLKSD